ncbi:MAG TPA: hypothetical protein PLR06_00215 [Cyclobacteriaceae bacterium]|nr:hypothetical protein [Cyclobacteriaceae bacterium]
MEEFLKAIPVFLGSMVKFILGPTIGFGAQLHFLTTVLVTVAGMMTSVTIFTYFGDWIRKRFFKNKNKTDSDKTKYEGLWKKHGLTGIALLTPVILTPIGGTLLAVSSGSPKEKIIFYMFVSAALWSLIFTGVIYFVGRQVLPEFVK